ncbi:MAG: helix-turn-helix domain containing protein [Deltaproteobacteria bacterium]|nr:helix-turn-helix domain containing protein [Deltaproteobacteria bacterium]
MAESTAALEEAKNENKQIARLFEAAGCRTQAELAELLGIRQSSIAVAKRRNRLPADWLLKLLRLRNINPDWIIFGEGAKYLYPLEGPETTEMPALEEKIAIRALDGLIMRRILGCFRAKDLQSELVRRKKDGSRAKPR